MNSTTLTSSGISPLADVRPNKQKPNTFEDAATSNDSPYGLSLAKAWVVDEFKAQGRAITLRRLSAGRDFAADNGTVFQLVATMDDAQGHPQMIGQAQWALDKAACAEPVTDGAVFHITVADAHRRQGVGAHLLRALMQSATLRGLRWLHTRVPSSHTGLLALAQQRGFWQSLEPDDYGCYTLMAALPGHGGAQA
jgi:GNAT superfamily N-acetyltransferase